MLGAEVVLKFYYGNRHAPNKMISKTMGRIAVINTSYQGEMPQNGSFWLCRIVQHIEKPNSSGLYVVDPQTPLDISKVQKLLPGLYDISTKDQQVLCFPKLPGFWIMPTALKKMFLRRDAQDSYQSIIVPVPHDTVR